MSSLFIQSLLLFELLHKFIYVLYELNVPTLAIVVDVSTLSGHVKPAYHIINNQDAGSSIIPQINNRLYRLIYVMRLKILLQ